MMNPLVAEKIRTEALCRGIGRYHIRTEIYPLDRVGDEFLLMVNTPDLMVFHDFTAILPTTLDYATLKSVVVRGSIESRTYDQNGLDMEIVGKFGVAPGPFLTHTRFRVPVLFAAINQIQVIATPDTAGLVGGTAYILGTTVVPQ